MTWFDPSPKFDEPKRLFSALPKSGILSPPVSGVKVGTVMPRPPDPPTPCICAGSNVACLPCF